MGGFLLFLILLCGGLLVYVKWQGNRAFNPLYVDVVGLTTGQIVEIGTKPGVWQLLDGAARPAAQRTADGAIEWNLVGSAGVMTFRVAQCPDGPGFRVTGFATLQKTAVRNSRAGGIWGMSSGIADMIAVALKVPKNPGRLLRTRRRVLNKIESAAASAPTSRRV